MANPHKGEVSFESKGQSYKLSFSANALCELEDALNKNVNEISALMQNKDQFRMSMLRTVFWAGLLDHQPGIQIEAAKEILSGITPLEAISWTMRAFSLAYEDDGKAAGGGDARPTITTPALAQTG
jgi:hypothetical protein